MFIASLIILMGAWCLNLDTRCDFCDFLCLTSGFINPLFPVHTCRGEVSSAIRFRGVVVTSLTARSDQTSKQRNRAKSHCVIRCSTSCSAVDTQGDDDAPLGA